MWQWGLLSQAVSATSRRRPTIGSWTRRRSLGIAEGIHFVATTTRSLSHAANHRSSTE